MRIRIVALLGVIGAVPCARAHSASAQSTVVQASSETEPTYDYLFPKSGQLSLSAGTGVPFLAISEVTIGLTDRFALGVLGGTTPFVAGIGIRPRISLFELDAYRVNLVVPILYYPSTHSPGGEPWVLARPTLSVERASESGARTGLGIGIVAASCIDSILSLGRESSDTFMGGVWEALTLTQSIPLSSRTSVFAEGTLIMRGLGLAGPEWVGGPPFAVQLGVTTTL